MEENIFWDALTRDKTRRNAEERERMGGRERERVKGSKRDRRKKDRGEYKRMKPQRNTHTQCLVVGGYTYSFYV